MAGTPEPEAELRNQQQRSATLNYIQTLSQQRLEDNTAESAADASAAEARNAQTANTITSVFNTAATAGVAAVTAGQGAPLAYGLASTITQPLAADALASTMPVPPVDSSTPSSEHHSRLRAQSYADAIELELSQEGDQGIIDGEALADLEEQDWYNPDPEPRQPHVDPSRMTTEQIESMITRRNDHGGSNDTLLHLDYATSTGKTDAESAVGQYGPSRTRGSQRITLMFIHSERIQTAPRLMRLLLCTTLAVAGSACAPRQEHATPSPSLEAEPVFLDEEVLCEAVSHELLKEELSFQVEDYNYKHNTSTDTDGNPANSFNCNLYGQQSPPDKRYGLRIGYAPNGKLNANSHDGFFTDLDSKNLDPITFEGIEGRGYVWIYGDKRYLSAAWLYPDGHALDIALFPETDSKPPYDEADIEAMRHVLKELITTIPPVAAGPDRLTTSILDPHDRQHTERPTAHPSTDH